MNPGPVLNLRVGEIVEVRGEKEILASLDERGELECLPFMPEMLQFCGQRFKVYRLALKLCDTLNGTGMHRMRNSVLLENVRCGGQEHGGCQAGCLTYWKEAWVKRVAPGDQEFAPQRADGTFGDVDSGCTRWHLLRATRKGMPTEAPLGEEMFSCQATEIIRAAPERVAWWDVRGYIRDVRSGHAQPLAVTRTVCVLLFNKFQGFSRRYLPKFLWIREGKKFPFVDGTLATTPCETLDLQPGDRVRVKTKEEILRTLDAQAKNRGLRFDAEMLQWCGHEARVANRLVRIVDEHTGRMMQLKNPSIVLEDVVCSGRYNQCCARGGYPYWREIWLSRLD